MSHFSVIVIGNDPEKQLAPYHEFECTGEDDEYVQTIDDTEKVREHYNSSDRALTFRNRREGAQDAKILPSGTTIEAENPTGSGT